jgi:hypothetical protein
MGELVVFQPNDAARRAICQIRDNEAFSRTWPTTGSKERPMPPFTWEQLQRQLEDLASSEASAAMVGPLVSGTRKQAAFKPPELVLREILCLAWTLMDEAFQPGPGSGEEGDML